MVIDLHNHTLFSYDGKHTAYELADNACSCGIDVLGISDHQFTDGFDFGEYIKQLRKIRQEFSNRCEIKIGLEVGTRPKPDDFLAKSMSKSLDYCLFESLDSDKGMDFFEFVEWRRLLSCKVGLAHTDIFKLEEKYGIDILAVLKKEEIFWEINTSGNYTYYYDFITNSQKRKRVSKSGITLSVGSDTHRLYELNLNKLISANELVCSLGNPVLFSRGR